MKLNGKDVQIHIWRMLSSRMLRRVAPVRTDVSQICSASIIRVTRIGEVGTTSVLKESHDVTSQKTAFLIVTAVKTSNLRDWYLFLPGISSCWMISFTFRPLLCTHCIDGRTRTAAIPDDVKKWKFLIFRSSKNDHSVLQSVAKPNAPSPSMLENFYLYNFYSKPRCHIVSKA
jgi:hypothetical protein